MIGVRQTPKRVGRATMHGNGGQILDAKISLSPVRQFDLGKGLDDASLRGYAHEIQLEGRCGRPVPLSGGQVGVDDPLGLSAQYPIALLVEANGVEERQGGQVRRGAEFDVKGEANGFPHDPLLGGAGELGVGGVHPLEFVLLPNGFVEGVEVDVEHLVEGLAEFVLEDDIEDRSGGFSSVLGAGPEGSSAAEAEVEYFSLGDGVHEEPLVEIAVVRERDGFGEIDGPFLDEEGEGGVAMEIDVDEDLILVDLEGHGGFDGEGGSVEGGDHGFEFTGHGAGFWFSSLWIWSFLQRGGVEGMMVVGGDFGAEGLDFADEFDRFDVFVGDFDFVAADLRFDDDLFSGRGGLEGYGNGLAEVFGIGVSRCENAQSLGAVEFDVAFGDYILSTVEDQSDFLPLSRDEEEGIEFYALRGFGGQDFDAQHGFSEKGTVVVEGCFAPSHFDAGEDELSDGHRYPLKGVFVVTRVYFDGVF